MGKYYAVVVGRVPGIYQDWNSAKQQVSGYPGAIFKGFLSLTEAEGFLKASQESQASSSSPQKVTIYTDGSFSRNACGFGVVIIDGSRITTAYGRVPLPPTNNVAELYAIHVALSLVPFEDVVIHSDSRYCISALTSYFHSWQDKDWTSVANKVLLQTILHQMKERKVQFLYVPAHQGHLYNEKADSLANRGRLQENSLVVEPG